MTSGQIPIYVALIACLTITWTNIETGISGAVWILKKLDRDEGVIILAKAWTEAEEKLLRKKYPTHTLRDLVYALSAAGYDRTVRAVRRKCYEMGLAMSGEEPPFCYQLTVYCDPGDPFLPKVESNLRRENTPYIVATDADGRQAIFCQPLDGTRSQEPVKRRWARWYNHPVDGTWPSYVEA